ncbi:protein ecsB [Companilactobacillus sp. RD055328]|uniref:ABC transporter permease n=1 Tax=Companilactobacillus sp. RD055328 TaxID=2916634 RepID=UPI001FC8B7A9|nr:ABC transporter permease [Companilactobacillus sp. RD055328]GKQ42494.1 protein ecsB [Companilactobacillus sp. RD055328]
MSSLWKKRLSNHQTSQLKYLRLIFNDQFVIALIFLIGSLGFWYSNVLKTITTEQWWAKIIVAVILTVLVSVGHLATLLETADSTFLLAKENQLPEYLKKARNYSYIIPFVVIALGMFLLFPFANIAASINLTEYSIYIIATYLFKIVEIDIEKYELYIEKNFHLVFLMGVMITYLVSIYVSYLILGIVAIAITIIDMVYAKQLIRGKLFLWNKAIKKENARSFNIKRFYNLFTDVPGMSSKIVRRKYLDFIVNRFKASHEHSYIYIYIRGFIRNNEYIGLFLRLTIIEMAILFFVNNIYVASLISGLFIYLVGFQLKPFYKQYASNLMQQIYPVNIGNKIKDFQKLVTSILLTQLLISIIPVVYAFGISVNTIAITGIGLLVILLFVYILLPKDLKKFDE